ncbi:hypothetical protein NPA08_00700 [Mycoplasmopsis citelli]|uniref:Transmembrane protein n=1 Tax=Mycoplasmopsis citelli TaxID=171281 RepID=A0A449B2G3_9BACT|nr:hypothetical protein [Mycoplasmopsis citelli]UUD36343.1 hypothetical protein NPA08_00700 [Mycoplasmopsis citelli]VEU74782.1 Uncharacterised protein [Mycoplasmopsis citelli]
MNYFKSYAQRKILVLVALLFGIIAVILLVVLINNFFARIIFEKEWLKDHLKSVLAGKNEAETNSIIELRSTSIQLKTIFLSLVSIAITSLSLGIILAIVTLVGLFSNRFNGNKIIKVSVWLILLAFVMIFFIIALQPAQLTITVTVQIPGPDGRLFNVNQSTISDRVNYVVAWLAMFLSFFEMIILIKSRLKYGFLTNDIVLNRKFKQVKVVV